VTLATDYRECPNPHCRTRILPPLRHFPPLNYARDPAGQVAVTFTHPRTARWLSPGEEPGPLEHRPSQHDCAAVADAP
jgi:hypothetical protein